MDPIPLPKAEDFTKFSQLYLNENGRFIQVGEDIDGLSDAIEIELRELPDHLKRRVSLQEGVTDVFVWVHGWRNDAKLARATARKLFNGIELVYSKRGAEYPNLTRFKPGFVAVHWPSMSNVFGYSKIRDRARAMIDKGEAEFFLASLLGYLDRRNQRDSNQKVLRAKGGYFI